MPEPSHHGDVDKQTVGTKEGALTVGTRIAVRWEHGWEEGTVASVLIDHTGKLHTYTVAYDDGETHDEDLRKEDARYLDQPPAATKKRPLAPSGGDAEGPEVRKTRHSLHTCSTTYPKRTSCMGFLLT